MNIESTNVSITDTARNGRSAICYAHFSHVFNFDCVEGMKQYPDKYFDLAVVDPPYGISANKMTLGNGKNKIYRGENDWDKNIPTKEYFTELFRVSKNQIIWGGNYMTEFLTATGAWIFWDKGTGNNSYSDGELAWTSFNGALRKFYKSWVGANAKDNEKRIHPTEKPKALYKFCFEYAKLKNGANILDTHLGSGNSRIVAKKMNFNFVGYEIDKGYFDAANENYEKEINGIIKIDNQKIVTQVSLF